MNRGFAPNISENGPMKRRIDKQTLIVSAGVGIGLFLIITGLQAGSTGRDAQRIPAVIERMSPGPGDQVLQQSQILVDFIDGYEAELTVDGVDIPTTRLDELTGDGVAPRPGAQVEIPSTAIYDPGNYTISFLPQEGAPITTLTQGVHTAVVRYWKVEDGKNKARSFSWEFQAD
jgi:hypothetical protein